ncbi:ATP-binding protein [Actinophytocola sp. NPDC049390]|uniref:ATP-binding protein n=1 Tax=Actinophytocola sp. NPDC049390 TaxID=3363894 RepID=UPI0037B2F383
MTEADEPGEVVWASALRWDEDLANSGVAALPAIRVWVRRTAGDLGDDVLTDLLLVVVELVTNAIEHGGGPRALRLTRTDTEINVEVEDANLDELTPGVSRFGPAAHRGAGLVLVRRICRVWGVRRHPAAGGKTVWSTMPCADHARHDEAVSPTGTTPSRR